MLFRLMMLGWMMILVAPCFGVSYPNAPTQSTPPPHTTPSSSTQPAKPSSHMPLREKPSSARNPEKASRPPQTPQETVLTKGDAKQIFSVIENQLNAIQARDYMTAYHSYVSEEFKRTTPLDEFIFFVSSYTFFTNNKNSLFRHLRLENNIATLEGTMTSATGEENDVQYFFVKEGELWKIIGIKILNLQPIPSAPKLQEREKPQDKEQHKENPLEKILKEHPLLEQKKKPEAAMSPGYRRERYYTY